MSRRITLRSTIAFAAAASLVALACRDDLPLAPQRAAPTYALGDTTDVPPGGRPLVPLRSVGGSAAPIPNRPLLSGQTGGYPSETLGSLTVSNGVATDANDSGWVVGYGETVVGNPEPVVWVDGEPGPLSQVIGQANAVNNRGDIVGWARQTVTGPQHAFLFRNGVVTYLGALANYEASVATDINDAGDIVGYAYTKGTAPTYRAVRFVPGGNPAVVELGIAGSGNESVAYGVNAAGDVAGAVKLSAKGLWQAARKKNALDWEALGSLGSSTESYAWALNDSGQVVGYSRVPGGTGTVARATRWDAAGAAMDLGTVAGGTQGYAFGISRSGEAVGYSVLADGTRRPTHFTAAGGPQDMGDPDGVSISWGSTVGGISENGRWAVGTGPAMDADGGSVAIRWDLAPPRPPVPATVPDSVPEWVDADSGYARDIPGHVGRSISRTVVWAFFRTNATQRERQAAVDATAGEVIGGARWDDLGSVGRYFIRVPTGAGGEGIEAALTALRANSAVHLAGSLAGAPVTFGSLAPNDGAGWERATWARHRSAASQSARRALEMIDAPLAWGCETGDSTVAVALVDGGIYQNVDDYNWNLGASGPRGFRSSGVPSQFVSQLRRDDSTVAHGTKVASIMAAMGNNGVGMTGVMWRADLRYETARLVWRRSSLNYDPGALLDRSPREMVDGVARQVRHGARVINVSSALSYEPGTDTSVVRVYVDELESLWRTADSASGSRHPLFVTAAGNDTANAEISLFAQLSRRPHFANRMLVVAASNADGNALAAFSNFGDEIDVVAPGAMVGVLNARNVVSVDSGTSFAAPLVSGVAGLLFSFDPTMTAEQAREYILTGASDSIDVQGTGRRPFLNAYGALRRAARRRGAPLCGNKVWTTPGSVWVEREPGAGGTEGAEAIFADSAINLAMPYAYHGGRHLGGVAQGVAANYMIAYEAANRRWVPRMPFDETGLVAAGAARSWQRATHNGDTTFSIFGATPGAERFTLSGTAGLGTIRTFDNPTPRSYAKVCTTEMAIYTVETDSTTDPPTNYPTGFESYQCHVGLGLGNADSIDVAPSHELSPQVAPSPTGKFVIVAVNLQSGPDGVNLSPWEPCSPDTPVLFGQPMYRCRQYTFKRRSAGTIFYRVSLEPGHVGEVTESRVLDGDGRETFDVAVSEDGETIIADRGATERFYGLPRTLQLPPARRLEGAAGCTAFFYRWPPGGTLQEVRRQEGTIGCTVGRKSSTMSPRPRVTLED